MDNNNIEHLLKIIKYALVLAIVILIINFLTPIGNSVSALLDRLAPPAVANIVSSQTIINSITELGELVTVSAETSKMDVFIEVNKGRPEYFSARHRVTGIIEAGINFADISADYIDEEYWTLTLSPTMITSCRILDIEQYDWSTTVLQAPWDKVRQLAQHVSSLQFAEDMAEEGILEDAQLQAELRLRDFVSSLTGKPVVVVFKPRDEEIDFHEACDMEQPDNWEDTGDGGWVQTG